MRKKLTITLLLTMLLFTIGGVGGGVWLYWQIVKEPGEEIQFENIQKILGRESHVLYRDGTTPLGVFFDTSHRQYVHFDEIPQNFVNALIASEDSRFFRHWGFDLESIGRAMIKNLKARRVVQGGSTLTQQTAKNLFKRKDRSFSAKFKELLMALKLEYYYSKEQIFEFYANQFYVSGNGVGLGVAARYYFDKTPAELDLVECAFIAGSVNRPNYYNPFRKKSEKGVTLARQRAQTRLKYVLGEMRTLGMIDQPTYNRASETPIAFNQGKVGYSLDYVMDLVREAVSSDDVLNALAEHDIENIATSGVRVITNVDQMLQQKTLAALRRHLSTVDVMLRGYGREEVQQELAALDYSGDSTLEVGAFLLGTVTQIHNKKGAPAVDVKLDKKLGEGRITASGLADITSAWVKHQRNNRYAEVAKKDVARFLKHVQAGDRVWVEVTALPPVSTEEQSVAAELSLARYPQVQGGAVVVQGGQILAIAGGTENRFFNRGFAAKRAMGSAFKPLVYTAAIQLGWNSADLLYNARAVYDYQGQPYFPRPDHHNPNTWVSMNWAGVRSENLATIWLLSRLCDKLSPLQFQEVAQRVGLAPRTLEGEEESYQAYRRRIRDLAGILVSRTRLKEAAYRMALNALEPDFLFDGMAEEFRQLINLPYGDNFEKYEKEIDRELEKTSSVRQRQELGQRKQMLQKSFLKLQAAYQPFTQFREQVTAELNRFVFFEKHSPVFGPLYKGLADGAFYFLPFGGDVTAMIPFSGGSLMDHLQGLDEEGRRRFWEDIRLNGDITIRALQRVQMQLESEYAGLLSRRPYDFDILQNIDEFRVTVGLYYLVQLGQRMGISSTLAPVLSFPLGSNVVTPFELTRVYETLATGSLVKYGKEQQEEEEGDEESSDVLAVIKRIESADGEVLYTPKRKVVRIVDAKTRVETNSILENVIRFGTGYYASQHVRYRDDTAGKGKGYPVPLLGKTGTSNRYTNGSFFGYVPVVNAAGNAMTTEGGYAVGVYCGYDDNRSMKHKRIRISGSSGALPVWSEIATAILAEEDITGKLDPVDLSFYGLNLDQSDPEVLHLAVDREQGGRPVAKRGEDGAEIRTFGTIGYAGQFRPKRHFSPFWRAEERQKLSVESGDAERAGGLETVR